jgi:hypothetical protein
MDDVEIFIYIGNAGDGNVLYMKAICKFQCQDHILDFQGLHLANVTCHSISPCTASTG